jgi:hypothetical protein
MQDLTLQGITPPPLAPGLKAFGATAGGPKNFGAAAGNTPETPAGPITLADNDRFYLEILAEEDASIEIPPEPHETNSSGPAPTNPTSQTAFFGDDGLTFGDFLDVINPLQHIPVVSTLYRELTGDEISPAARMAGGALFGGPIGFAAATVNSVVEMSTGSDVGETVIAAITGGDSAGGDSSEPKAVATADSIPATIAASVQSPAAPVRGPAPVNTRMAPAASSNLAQPVPKQSVSTGPASLMNLYKSSTPSRAMTPTEALIQARAAVPMAGPIKGLGNSVRTRFQAVTHRTQPIAPASLPTRPTPQTSRTAPAAASAAPQISARLSNQLTLLAAQSEVQAKAPQNSTPSKTAPRKAGSVSDASGTNGGATPPAPLPTAQIPAAMRNALDRYEQMKQRQLSPR